MSEMMQCNRKSHDNTVCVCVCVCCSGHSINHSVSAVSGQELQTAFNDLFTTCQAFLRIGGSQIQQVLQYSVIYVLHEEM
jgi:hypothetical protein